MNKEERLNRINELARKQRGIGLTEEEKAEQAKLRKEYLEDFHKTLRGQMDNISIQNPDGSIVSLKDIRTKK